MFHLAGPLVLISNTVYRIVIANNIDPDQSPHDAASDIMRRLIWVCTVFQLQYYFYRVLFLVIIHISWNCNKVWVDESRHLKLLEIKSSPIPPSSTEAAVPGSYYRSEFVRIRLIGSCALFVVYDVNENQAWYFMLRCYWCVPGSQMNPLLYPIFKVNTVVTTLSFTLQLTSVFNL